MKFKKGSTKLFSDEVVVQKPKSSFLKKAALTGLVLGGGATAAYINPKIGRTVRYITNNETDFDKAQRGARMMYDKMGLDKDNSLRTGTERKLNELEDSKLMRKWRESQGETTLRDRWLNFKDKISGEDSDDDDKTEYTLEDLNNFLAFAGGD